MWQTVYTVFLNIFWVLWPTGTLVFLILIWRSSTLRAQAMQKTLIEASLTAASAAKTSAETARLLADRIAGETFGNT